MLLVGEFHRIPQQIHHDNSDYRTTGVCAFYMQFEDNRDMKNTKITLINGEVKALNNTV